VKTGIFFFFSIKIFFFFTKVQKRSDLLSYKIIFKLIECSLLQLWIARGKSARSFTYSFAWLLISKNYYLSTSQAQKFFIKFKSCLITFILYTFCHHIKYIFNTISIFSLQCRYSQYVLWLITWSNAIWNLK
jgi:hypothetical protein